MALPRHLVPSALPADERPIPPVPPALDRTALLAFGERHELFNRDTRAWAEGASVAELRWLLEHVTDLVRGGYAVARFYDRLAWRPARGEPRPN